ncbi:MAG: bifunctional adenosylcobinamide kinase/adenosylcobinamide-phosphate guanylyltransferase [Angustibacter sp.]
MHLHFLGTGSADGWPNAFCTCAACHGALTSGDLRCPTSILVNRELLLDCGPETPRNALRFGPGLSQLRYILITHDHPDHSAPMALLSRSWSTSTLPLTVCGPADVLARWSQWVAPQAPITWQLAQPGAVFDLGDYRVRVLAAAHAEQSAVLYDLEWSPAPGHSTPPGPSTSSRLLYATDTGPLPDQTLAATADRAYHAVLLDATFGERCGPGAPDSAEHLDLGQWARQISRLTANGAITRETLVAPIHLSHHSPPGLARRLDAWGAHLVHDGQEVFLGPDAPRAPVTGPPPSGHRTLILGGARSGKSHLAEQLVAAHPSVHYLATGPTPTAADPDWAARVAAHRARRPQTWRCTETTDLATELTSATGPVLIDCLALWLTAVLDRSGAWTDQPGWSDVVTAEIDALIEAWHAVTVPVVAVSNEVGLAVVPSTRSGRIFRDHLGQLNRRLSLASEEVLLVVAGRALPLHGDS